MMLNMNMSEINRERAILNFGILHGLSIDVGKVIHNTILHIISSITTSGLDHSSLIDNLCCVSRVAGLSSKMSKILELLLKIKRPLLTLLVSFLRGVQDLFNLGRLHQDQKLVLYRSKLQV